MPQRYPVESLTSFYKRSSYDQLNIGGNVIGWYTTPYPRTDITDARAVIKEALTYYETQGHDFSQYDNDGYIDYFSVVWTGAVGEWASLWWGWQSSFSDANYTLTGKQLAAFSWQWLSWNNEIADPDRQLKLIIEGENAGNTTEALITIQNEDIPGNVKFAMENISVKENESIIPINIFHYGDGITPHSLKIKAISDTAIAGVDFEAYDIEYTLAGDEYTKSFDLKTINNRKVDVDRKLKLVIDSDYLINGSQEIVMTINNDDKTTPTKPVEPEKSSSGGSLAFLLVFIPLILRRYTK